MPAMASLMACWSFWLIPHFFKAEGICIMVYAIMVACFCAGFCPFGVVAATEAVAEFSLA